jgi:hypothetical protein
MKTILFVFLNVFIFSSLSSPQVNYYYYPVPSGTTNNLYSINFNKDIYSNNYITVITGAAGTVLRNVTEYHGINFGTNWVTIQTGNQNDYRGITQGNTFMYGYSGAILYSSNQGLNWVNLYNNNPSNLYSGSNLIDSSYMSSMVFVVGGQGTILVSYDSNYTTYWRQIQSGTTNNLKSIFFNGNAGWISGANGTLLKSTNKGLNWILVNSGISNELNSIYFKDFFTGFVVGEGGIILKTTNSGANWIQLQSGTVQTLNYITQSSKLINGNTYYTQWIVGNNGTTLFSTNDGTNWIADNYVPQVNLNSCQFLFNNLWIVGNNGKIYKRCLDTVYHPNEYVKLSANNISATFINSGIFNKSYEYVSGSGLEWPKGSNKFAVYSSGLNIAARVNGQVRMAAAAFKGEYTPGYCVDGNFYTNVYFKIYKVSKSENAQTSWDWANWGQMVPYGAPYIDVNNNGIYEPAIDTPGVRNAKETIFYCMTDADYSKHDPGEGFGGGTQPLGAEVHMIAWAYDNPALQDVQFVSYEIVNKSTNIWNGTQFGIFCDPDLGDGGDDYIGCDTTLKLSYCFNADNNDNIYGANPPAVGFSLLVSPLNRSVTPNQKLGMTSFIKPEKSSSGFPVCEFEPDANPYGAYLMLCGYKKDSTCYINPTQNPPTKTKYCFTGDPETNIGWTAYTGVIGNCNHDSTGNIVPYNAGDKRFLFSSGAYDFNMTPGESQKFIFAQMMARGSSNLNSVTVLKNLCANVRDFSEQNFPNGINQITYQTPAEFALLQNYPNPFNPLTTIKYRLPNFSAVSLKVYDILGRQIQTLVNAKQDAGTYEVTFDGGKYASGIYFYKMVSGDFTQTKKMLLIK